MPDGELISRLKEIVELLVSVLHLKWIKYMHMTKTEQKKLSVSLKQNNTQQ